MDADRRHELQENELAKDLGVAGEFVKNHVKELAIGFLVAVLLIFAVVNWASSMKLSRQIEWSSYYQYSSQDIDLQDMDQYLLNLEKSAQALLDMGGATGQKDLAALAYISGGEQLMRLVNLKWLDLSEDERGKQLSRAETAFNRVISSYSSNKVAVAKATLNLARLAELKGDYAAASDLYKKVVDMPAARGAISEAAKQGMAIANDPPAEIILAAKPVEPEQPEEDQQDQSDSADQVETE